MGYIICFGVDQDPEALACHFVVLRTEFEREWIKGGIEVGYECCETSWFVRLDLEGVILGCRVVRTRFVGKR